MSRGRARGMRVRHDVNPMWPPYGHTQRETWGRVRTVMRRGWEDDSGEAGDSAWELSEPALRFGYVAATSLRGDWTPTVEAQLRDAWTERFDEPWDDAYSKVRFGWARAKRSLRKAEEAAKGEETA